MYIYPLVPGQPTVRVSSISSTSISLSWNVPNGSVVTSYEVMWQALSSGDEANDDGGSGTIGSITSTSYTIQELESLTIYSVTVTVINDIGITVSQPIIISSMIVSTNTHYMSLHSLHPLLALTATQSDSWTDNTAAVTGWVVAVVFIITTVAAVIVIAVLWNHRGHYSTGTHNFMCF